MDGHRDVYESLATAFEESTTSGVGTSSRLLRAEYVRGNPLWASNFEASVSSVPILADPSS